jgi:hypothetical protein
MRYRYIQFIAKMLSCPFNSIYQLCYAVQVIASKAKGQSGTVAKPELLAFAYSCGPVPQRIEEPISNRLVLGWNPSRSATLNSPICSANYSRGITSGKPKAGLLRSTVILSFSPEESKAQSDVPFVQNPDRKSGSRTKRCPAVEVPAMRQAVL